MLKQKRLKKFYLLIPQLHLGVRNKELLSFLQRFSPIENTQHLKNVLEEYGVLEPFKAFLNVPCEICH